MGATRLARSEDGLKEGAERRAYRWVVGTGMCTCTHALLCSAGTVLCSTCTWASVLKHFKGRWGGRIESAAEWTYRFHAWGVCALSVADLPSHAVCTLQAALQQAAGARKPVCQCEGSHGCSMAGYKGGLTGTGGMGATSGAHRVHHSGPFREQGSSHPAHPSSCLPRPTFPCPPLGGHCCRRHRSGCLPASHGRHGAGWCHGRCGCWPGRLCNDHSQAGCEAARDVGHVS